MHVAANVKHLRNKRGLTQSGLAKELEKTTAAISDYEKGKATPPLEVALRISRFFKVTLDDLVGKDLRREDMLIQEGRQTHYRTDLEQTRKQLETQERVNQLLEQRLAELEREIREQAPELAARLGLDKG